MKIDIDMAKEKIHEYPYALIYFFDKVVLSDTADLTGVEWENCLEARFFGENGELRIWRYDNELLASEYSGNGEAVVTDYNLDRRFGDKWRTVSIKQFIDYDEDGQAYICGTTLSGLRGI